MNAMKYTAVATRLAILGRLQDVNFSGKHTARKRSIVTIVINIALKFDVVWNM